VVNLGDAGSESSDWRLVNYTRPLLLRRNAVNPLRDAFDENIPENKWSLFYYEIINNSILDSTTNNNNSDSNSNSDSDSAPYLGTSPYSDDSDKTISAIWIKRSSAILWPGANYYSNYHIYGNPIGVQANFIECLKEDFTRDIGDLTPLLFSGDINLGALSTIDIVGGYLIEKIKYIADNQLAGDGSTREMGAGVSVITMAKVVSVPGTTTTEELDEITLSLLNS
jgi:hypothetical protein